MTAFTINSETAHKLGRLDVRFLALHQKHQKTVNELMEKYTREELVALAKSLPFDEQAANAVLRGAAREFRSDLVKWVDGFLAVDAHGRHKAAYPAKHAELAVYCAAAADGAASKVLAEVLALSERKKALLDGLHGLLDTAAKSPALLAAIKGKE